MENVARTRAIMSTFDWRTRFIPLGLGAAMLATVVAAALSPNLGSIPAQATAQYGTPAGTSTPFPWWIIGVIIAIVAALIVAYLLVGRRRRPPARSAPPPQMAGPPTGAAIGAPPPPPGPASAYIETPEDVGAAMPAVAGVAAGAGGAGAAAGAAEPEPDIDALMAELDKISGEILKKPPKGGGAGSSEGSTAEGTGK